MKYILAEDGFIDFLYDGYTPQRFTIIGKDGYLNIVPEWSIPEPIKETAQEFIDRLYPEYAGCKPEQQSGVTQESNKPA